MNDLKIQFRFCKLKQKQLTMNNKNLATSIALVVGAQAQNEAVKKYFVDASHIGEFGYPG